MKKRIISFLMTLLLLFSLAPLVTTSASAATSYTYTPSKAVAWAKNSDNVNDFDGLCARFVSTCLQKGGLKDVNYGVVGDMMKKIVKSGYGQAYKINDTTLKMLKAGDVIVVKCSNHSSNYYGLHTIFVTEVNYDEQYIRYSAKNNDHCNAKMTFSALKSYKVKCGSCGTSEHAYAIILSMNSADSVFNAKLFNNYSGKNYIPYFSTASSDFSSHFLSRDTSVNTISCDSSVKRVSDYSTIKIVNKSAGSVGKDLSFKTYTSYRACDGSYTQDQDMTMSFWAKANTDGAKMYFRWGYEEESRYITLTKDWKYYTVNMNHTKSYNGVIQSYVDTAGTVWLSELQLEEGDSATSFAAETGGIYGTITANYGGKYTSLPTPTRSGYTFDGWYTAPNGGTLVTSNTSVYTANIYLYAHWSTSGHTHSYSSVVTAPTCTKSGYTTHKCSCGSSYVDNYTAALGHNYVNGKCSVCGALESAEHIDSCPSADYLDVPAYGTWSHNGIDFCIDREIMGSTNTDKLTFEPSTSCTRAMIVSILYRMQNSPDVTYTAKFTDVKSDQWYTDAVIWAAQNGVVSGYTNGTFGPNDKLTREQLAVILMNYTSKILGKDTSARADISSFPDAGSATWSKSAMQWAVANGLISGSANGGKTYLMPQGNAARDQVASIFMRYITNIAEA